MIIWSGFGFLSPLIAFGCLVLAQVVTASATGNADAYGENRWVAFLASCIAGALCWGIGRWLDRKQSKVVIEKETGRETVLKPSHTFFFIPLRIYAFIWPIIGLFMLF